MWNELYFILGVLGSALGFIGFALYIAGWVIDPEESDISLKARVAFSTLGIVLLLGWIPAGAILTCKHHSFYYYGEMDDSQICELYNLIDDNAKVRDHLYIDNYVSYERIEFSTRRYDYDHLKHAIETLSFNLFETYDDYWEYRTTYECSLKGPEYKIMFDGSCQRCGAPEGEQR